MALAPILENFCTDNLENLPENLQDLEGLLKNFSSHISLHSYQQEALKRTMNCLYKYFNEKQATTWNNISNKPLNEIKNVWQGYIDKEAFKKLYEQNGVNANNKPYEFEDVDLINRCSYWMATGSGKTIVLVKLVEIIYQLIKLKYAPYRPILILAPNENILKQIEEHINYFNKANKNTIKINWLSLDNVENNQGELEFNSYSNHDEVNVYFYNSTNITDETSIGNKKDAKRRDYKNYLNHGEWYILLDEAHRGNQDTSKKKSYFNQLTENGFLFNFSATFTDEIDIVSTLFNFNLSKFVKSGYGKNVKVMKVEYKDFNKQKNKGLAEEFNNQETQGVILQSIIHYTAIKEHCSHIIKQGLYHNPLMLSVANSVTKKDSDAVLFFKYILEIAKQKPHNFERVRQKLVDEITSNKEPLHIFHDDKLYKEIPEIRKSLANFINEVDYKKVLKHFYNSEESGIIEYGTSDNKQDNQIVFKLKTSSTNKYFALLNIGDSKKWDKEVLQDYLQYEVIDKDNFFANINSKNSSINLLMGSRIFSEGWDSNRPNIINFINIGSKDAKKYVLQTIGRGVRVAPITGVRQRYTYIQHKENYPKLNDLDLTKKENSLHFLETVFVYATKKSGIEAILNEVDKEKVGDKQTENISEYFKKQEEVFTRLVPEYTYNSTEDMQYPIEDKALNNLTTYVNKASAKVLALQLAKHIETKDCGLTTINKIKHQENHNKYFNIHSIPYNSSENSLIIKIDDFFNSTINVIKGYKKITETHIKHYKEIVVKNIPKADLENLKEYLESFMKGGSAKQESMIDTLFDEDKITKAEYKDRIKNIKRVDSSSYINLENIKEHYYLPLAHKKDTEKITNIIDVESEIDFIKDLQEHLTEKDNKLSNIQWNFSKIEENVDEIFIQYVSSNGKIKRYYPDFIFWLKTNNSYRIIFIDPKGLTKTDNTMNEAKYKGFKDCFNKTLYYNGLPVTVQLFFYGQTALESISKITTKDLSRIFG